MKVIANICFLKLAKMVESDVQQYAGGVGPLGRKKSQEKCQDHVPMQHNGWQHLHLPATGAKVSTKSRAYRQAVSHGVSSMYSVLYF